MTLTGFSKENTKLILKPNVVTKTWFHYFVSYFVGSVQRPHSSMQWERRAGQASAPRAAGWHDIKYKPRAQIKRAGATEKKTF